MKISQREARRLKKRVAELEERNARNARSWSGEYVGGTQLATQEQTDVMVAIVSTARNIGRAVVVTHSGNKFTFYAVNP